MKQKNKIVLFSGLAVLALLAVIAVPSVSATYPANATYFEPENINGGEKCDNTYTKIMVNASVETVGLCKDSGNHSIDIFFDPSCVNITDVDFTGTPYDMLTGWRHYGNWVRIGVMSGPPVPAGIHLVANLTLHCESESECTSELGFGGILELLDPDGDPIPTTWYNGTYTCGKIDGRVPTYANVKEVNRPPNVQYKWEKPDDTPGDGYTNVYPIPGQTVTVDKYVVVCDPDGEEDIEKVIVRTFYPLPNGEPCECEPVCDIENCCNPEGNCMLKEWSVAEPLPDKDACIAAKMDALEEGLLTEEEVHEIDEFLDNGTGWIYVEHNEFNCSDPAGHYTVCAQVFDRAGLYDCMANTFEYMSIVSLTIDFEKVDYGVITPSVTKWVTPGNVKNDGNDPMDLVIESWNMTSVTGGVGVIPADKLDARIATVEHWLAPTPGVLFDVNLPGCTPTPITFSIHAPIGTPQDKYSGWIRLTGQHG